MIAEEPVLLVDDEENLLSGLRRQLRGKFEVFTAEGGDQALEMLENQRTNEKFVRKTYNKK